MTDSTGGKLEYTDLVEVARHGLISFFLNALVIAIFLFFLATS